MYTWPCQHKSQDGNICGEELDATLKFCTTCGTRVGSPLCRHCLVTLDEVEPFCHSCGQKLTGVQAPKQAGQLGSGESHKDTHPVGVPGRGFCPLRPKQKNSCVQVSLPTLILGPTLKMLNFFCLFFLYRNDLQST